MAIRVDLSPCLMSTFKDLFPTLQWSRIDFLIGIPSPFSGGGQEAITLASGNRIKIHFREDAFQPCTREFFVRCAHELVHALQIQESFAEGRGVGYFNAFNLKYLTCYLHGYSAAEGEGNEYEDEAYEYERRLEAALDQVPAADRLHCNCSAIPFGTPNPTFVGVAGLERIDRRVVKRRAGSHGACRGKVLSFGLGNLFTADFYNTLSWTTIGAIAGAIIGGLLCGPPCAIAGAFLGAMAGMMIGFIDQWTGIPSAILVAVILAYGALGVPGFIGAVVGTVLGALVCGLPCAVVGAIVGEIVGWLVGAIVGAFVDWLAPGTRELRVVFSQDDGQTFGDMVTVGGSGEPPALAFSPNHLFIGWITGDNDVNLVLPIAARDAT